MYRAWFINELGHKFSKEFKTGEAMEHFINKASEVGTRLSGFVSMEPTGISSVTKCIKCGRAIAETRQFISDKGYEYKTENLECRFIDKWGYERNFCKTCIQ